MNDQLNNINTATQASTTGCPVAQVCGSRLPCGVCLITNQKCPLTMPAYPTITWTSANDITCSTVREAKNNSITNDATCATITGVMPSDIEWSTLIK